MLREIASLCLILALARGQSTVRFQAGRRITSNSGQSIYYNSSYETAISTQYIDSWNNQNGETYFWGSTDPEYTYTLGDNNGDKFRTLIRFDNLHRFLPTNTIIQSAELSVLFFNWEQPVEVQACFMTRAWDYIQTGPRFSSTGWRFSRWNGSASIPWQQPGAWADCSRDVNISFIVPANGAYGTVSVTFALDAAKVAGWWANNGAKNYGLLLRAVNSTTTFVTGQWQGANPAFHRPSLSINYKTGSKQPIATYPVRLGAVPRTWWVSATAVNDDNNSGHADSPFTSLAKAVFEAWPGDNIYLMSGVYAGGVDITRPRITLRSAPGHWATVSLPMSDPQNAINVITLRPGADFGVISDLEITGGFYYGLMFFTSWENYGTMAERVALGAAPSHWLIQNLSIHDTGSSGVKLVMKATNVTFSKCEIYNTGARERVSGHGIVAMQSYDVIVRDCYFHDIPGAAVHLAAGTARALLERNYVARTQFGFNLGFTMEYEYMDGINNPALYESINATARNNIITSVNMAGINVWASRGALLAHNTIWQAQDTAQSCVLINAYLHDDAPSGPLLTRCHGLTLWANLLVRSTTARSGPVLQIREDGLDPTSSFLSAYNMYYDQKGLGSVPFQWGKGAMLQDERVTSEFIGNATGWARHCTVTLAQLYCDINSTEADPQLGSDFTPLACSPAKSRAAPRLPSGAVVALDDFHGRPRLTNQFDAGAVQSGAAGVVKPLPPVPAAFAGKARYIGVCSGPVYDRNWPYQYWSTRTCQDLYVDAVMGRDDQPHNYESDYRSPFKSIGVALGAMNQCDRILLKGGQNHTGGFGIYSPNVTIMTDPADLPGSRATVVCATANSGNPCIRTGDGLYGGAAAITLSNFDVLMTGSATGNCIHFNEGAGSGTSAYWAFYLSSRGLQPTLSYIQNMTLTSCSGHGIKLSTFVKGLVVRGITINRPGGTGIEVRGGGDLTLQANTILSPADTGIRLGGGVRNVLVEQNLIKNFGGRGILLGSDLTEVSYMDVDWARMNNDWHDCINTTVRNNIVDRGAGAGVAFYSAVNATVIHNTLLQVAATMQAGVTMSVSPKKLGTTTETGPPNSNITFRNNIVTLAASPSPATLMVETRVLQGTVVSRPLGGKGSPPNGSCRTSGRHLFESWDVNGAPEGAGSGGSGMALHGGVYMVAGRLGRAAHDAEHSLKQGDVAEQAGGNGGSGGSRGGARRKLASFADAYLNSPGEQGRNPDGSCPIFPVDNAWRLDVSALPVHSNNDAIKMRIGGGGLHADFGGGGRVNGQRVLYGIPFIVVDSSRDTPMVPIDIGPHGYADESDISPTGFPFPSTAPVEGAYTNCPNSICGGDRHVLVIDNATCLLYETYHSFPPGVTGTGRWQADQVTRFNLSRNAPGRPLGWTSADAAGLAILPGLVKWEEVVVRGVIDHAIRFTGPNSREAYVPPATHFAPTGYTGPDAPAMGTRVRLNASYDCSPLAQAARVFCIALKKYGGIFADNGSPWYFTGEATSKWDTVLTQLADISRIPSSAMEVLDSGCLCLDAGCTTAECNGVPDIDPNSLPLYPAIAAIGDLTFGNNIYFKSGSPAAAAVSLRFVDRRVPPLGPGYDGGLAGWKSYIGGDTGSVEADPKLDAVTYRPMPGSPASGTAMRPVEASTDFYGSPRGRVGGSTDTGAVLHA